MARELQSKVVILADDRTGSAFSSVASKLKSLASTAQQVKGVTAQVNAMRSALDATTPSGRIDLFRQAGKQALELGKSHRAALDGLRAVNREMSVIGPPTQALIEKHRQMQEQVRETGRALADQKAVVAAARGSLRDAGVDVTRLTSEQKRLAVATHSATEALRRQERSQVRRETATGIAATGGIIAAHAVKRGTKASLHTYREFDDERRFTKAVLGLSDEEMRSLVDQAIHGGATTKYNDIQYLHGQRDLAARGVKRDAILGMMPAAASFGMAAGQTLPEAVKLMEQGIFMFKKPTDTVGAATASAKQTADVMTMAMKISGMSPEDISHIYNYGAPSAKMAGVSEQNLLAFGGVLKKAGIRGDSAGTAWRALMATIQSPTSGARTAMLANGMDYSKYQKNPDKLALDPFVADVAAKYGVKLDKGAQAALGKVFSDKGVIADPAKFTPAVMSVLSDQLGGDDAKSKKSIAGLARRYRDASMMGVDSNAFITDMLTKMRDNLPFANAMFGAKQGSRIATALGDPETFEKLRTMLTEKSEGYAEKIAKERMAGFDGAVSRFEGAVKNLETAVGRAWDNSGEGKGGILTQLADQAAKATQGLAELSPWAMKVVSAGAGLAGVVGGSVGAWQIGKLLLTGGGLSASAVALDGSAAALTAAAARLGVAGALPGVPGIPLPGGAPASPKMSLPTMIGGALTLGTLGYLIWDEAGNRDPNGNPMGLNPTATSMRQKERDAAAKRQAADRELERRYVRYKTLDEAGVSPLGGFGQKLVPGVGSGDREVNRGRALSNLGKSAGSQELSQILSNANLTSKLEGAAEIKSKVEVSLEPGLKAKIDQAISATGHLSSGGVGSTGKSMPEAASSAAP